MSGNRTEVYRSFDACGVEWKFLRHVGRGTKGDVSEACCRDDCSFVVKMIRGAPGRQRLPTEIENGFSTEVFIQNMLAKRGIAPRVYEAWMTDGAGFIVMERLKITLKQYLRTYGGLSVMQMLELIGLVEQMHASGIYHGDLYDQNIALNGRDKFYIIDFGKSMIMHPVSDALQFYDFAKLLGTAEWSARNREELANYIKWRFPEISRHVSI
ncbi:MAG: protein kinase domain-containing protein [Sulfobacillus sp.]